MRILVACEESQAVTKELRRLGHEAYSCDIQECSGGHPEWHILADALTIINGRCTFETMNGASHTIDGRWDMLIAHPPCTYLTKAGACRLYKKAGSIDPERMEKSVEARLFFQKFLDADCERIAIENPTPLKVVRLPKPDQVIQPYQFGHPYSKRTCLWLKGLPILQATCVLGEYEPYLPSNTGNYSRGAGGSKGHAQGQRKRSRTFHGIARAMAEQWAGECKEKINGSNID